MEDPKVWEASWFCIADVQQGWQLCLLSTLAHVVVLELTGGSALGL